MASSPEYNYVSLWANRVPYPPLDYIEQAKKSFINAFNLYMNLCKGIKYNICFSNSTEIDLEIAEQNIAHMLGIECSNIKGPFHDDFRSKVLGINVGYNISTFNLLKKIIDNFDKIVEYETTGEQKKVLNYYRIFIKSCIFEKILNLSDYNYLCIDFNKDEYIKNSGLPCNFNSTMFLAVESEEACRPYYLMGILPDSNKIEKDLSQNWNTDNDEIITNGQNISYVVETLIAPKNPKDFLNNQEVVIPTNLVYDKFGRLNRIDASAEQKLRLLKMYRSALEKYRIESSRVDLSGDYALLLSREIDRKRLTNPL